MTTWYRRPNAAPNVPGAVLWAVVRKLQPFEPVYRLLQMLSQPQSVPEEWLESLSTEQHPAVSIDWADIVGQKEAKEALTTSVVFPFLCPQLFKDRSPYQGLLVVGPPGSGKSMLVKAAATASRATFLNVDVSRFLHISRGSEGKAVQTLFAMAKKLEPTVVAFEEIDLLSRSWTDDVTRRRSGTEFLVQMTQMYQADNGARSRVTVLGITNSPWDLRSSLRRRFEKWIHVSLCSHDERRELFERFLKNVKVEADFDFAKAASMTDNFSGADVRHTCFTLSKNALRRTIQGRNEDEIKVLTEAAIDPVTMDDLRSLLPDMKTWGLSLEELERYQLEEIRGSSTE